MEETPPGIRRVCLAIGVDKQAGGASRSAEPDGHLRAAVVDACVASGLPRMLLTLQAEAAAQVALLPVGIDEPRTIAVLTAELGTSLRKLNRHRPDGDRLRVMMAVDEGIMTLGPDGYHGYAITKACQLVNSLAVQTALVTHRAADLVVLLSERIYDDISRVKVSGLPTGICQRVEVGDSTGSQHDVGWIYIPPHLV